jgi:hypothetical protein
VHNRSVHNKFSDMNILFSTLIDVFAHVLCSWIEINCILILDSAFCNQEFRPCLIHLLSSNKVVFGGCLNINFTNRINSKSSISWLGKKQLKVTTYKFCQMKFEEHLEDSCGDIDLSSVTQLSVLMDKEKLSPLLNLEQRQINFLSLLNSCGELCHLTLTNVDDLCNSFVFKSLDPLVLEQLTYLHFNSRYCKDIVNYLSTMCRNLKELHCSQSHRPNLDYLEESELIRLIKMNPKLSVISCDYLCISNLVFDVLSELSELHGYQFRSIRFDCVVKDGCYAIDLDSLRNFYARCAITATIYLYIEDVLLCKSVWHNEYVEFEFECHSDVGSAVFNPSNSDLCVFFYDLGVSFGGTLKSVSLVGFYHLSPVVIDQLSMSFPNVERLRIYSCGVDFCSENNNPIIRMCVNGMLKCVDFDSKCSIDEFISFPLYCNDISRDLLVRFGAGDQTLIKNFHCK